MTTTDEPDAIADLDFPGPHSHLTPTELESTWQAEWSQIRQWQYELNTFWATHAGLEFVEGLTMKAELRRQIAEATAITLELEDALAEARKVKPTDIPTPWDGAA